METKHVAIAGVWVVTTIIVVGLIWVMDLTPSDALFGVLLVLFLSAGISVGLVRAIPESRVEVPAQLDSKLEEIDRRLSHIEEKVEKIERFIEE